MDASLARFLVRKPGTIILCDDEVALIALQKIYPQLTFQSKLGIENWLDRTPQKYMATFEEAAGYYCLFGSDLFSCKFIYVRRAVERLGEETIQKVLSSRVAKLDISLFAAKRFLIDIIGCHPQPKYDLGAVKTILNLFVGLDFVFYPEDVLDVYGLFIAGKKTWCPTPEAAFNLYCCLYDYQRVSKRRLFSYLIESNGMTRWVEAGFSPNELDILLGCGCSYTAPMKAKKMIEGYTKKGYGREEAFQSLQLLKAFNSS